MATGNHEHDLLTESFRNAKPSPEIHNISEAVPMNQMHEPRRFRAMSQPKGTISYTVTNRDTIEKVALHFNSTPSELIHLNKLGTRTLFPGQILFVRDQSSLDESYQQHSTTDLTSSSSSTKSNDHDPSTTIHKDHHLFNEPMTPANLPINHPLHKDLGPAIWSIARNSTARPGHAERLKSDASNDGESSPKTDSKIENHDNSKHVSELKRSSSSNKGQEVDNENIQRFIKLNVQLMTEEHASVSGTLLITPNAVMFDPSVLDPLVQEHGIEKYGLIIRMDLLVGIGLYEDLAMYEHESTFYDEEKRKLCHSTSIKSLQSGRRTSALNTDEEEIHELMVWMLDKIDKELNPSTSDDKYCMLFDASAALKRHLSMDSHEDSFDNDDTFLPIRIHDSCPCSDGTVRPLDEDRSTDSDTPFYSVPTHPIKEISNVFDWAKFRRAIKIKQGCRLENHVPLDQLNKRFVEIDELLRKQQEAYFGPHRIEIPYYLRLKTSTHLHDLPSLKARQYKKNSEKNLDSAYGRKQLKQEYWFSVPKEKTDSLYSFFLHWTPERALDPLIDDEKPSLNINQSKSTNESNKKGFVVLSDEDDQLKEDYIKSKNIKKQTKTTDSNTKRHYLSRQNTLLKDWEVRLECFYS